MCHPGFPLVSNKGVEVNGRWLVFRAPLVADTVTRHAQRPVAGEASGGGGGSSGEGVSVKQCVCSPTGHPGSFRCRQHHAEYVWRGRTFK